MWAHTTSCLSVELVVVSSIIEENFQLLASCGTRVWNSRIKTKIGREIPGL